MTRHPDLLSRPEAAALLGVSVSWLDHARAAGQGPRVVRIGRKVWYRRESLNDYLKQCEDEPCSTDAAKKAPGGADSKSAGGKFGGQLARQIASELRSKSEDSEPTTNPRHLIIVPAE